jgi:hypothetical protein
MRRPLSAGALAVPAPRPAAGPTPAFLQFLLGPANAPFSGHLLLGILDPADELVAGERSDVLPSIESRGVGDQRLEQVRGKLVNHPAGHSVADHRGRVAIQERACCRGHTRWLDYPAWLDQRYRSRMRSGLVTVRERQSRQTS